MVLVKILTLSLSLFFFKKGRNIVFEFVLKKKQPFPDYKNDLRRKSKIWHFSKGVSLWFWSKFSDFSFSWFFFKIGRNILFDYLQESKQPFLDYKDDITKKWKNWHFSKGVNPWFWSKFSNFSFSLFFFKLGLNIVFEFVLKKKQPFLDYKYDIRRKSKI